MNDRLSRDAADALINLEAQGAARQARIAAFGATAKAQWAKAQPRPHAGTWSPTISEQERQEREQQFTDEVIPF